MWQVVLPRLRLSFITPGPECRVVSAKTNKHFCGCALCFLAFPWRGLPSSSAVGVKLQSLSYAKVLLNFGNLWRIAVVTDAGFCCWQWGCLSLVQLWWNLRGCPCIGRWRCVGLLCVHRLGKLGLFIITLLV